MEIQTNQENCVVENLQQIHTNQENCVVENVPVYQEPQYQPINVNVLTVEQFHEMKNELFTMIRNFMETKTTEITNSVNAVLGRVVNIETALSLLNTVTQQQEQEPQVLHPQEEEILKLRFPMKTLEDLEKVEKELTDSDNTLKAIIFKKYRLSVPGTDKRSRGLRIVEEFLSPQLMCQLSWTGIRHTPNAPMKTPFFQFKQFIDTFKTICDCCESGGQTFIIDKFFTSVLQNAKTRLERKKKDNENTLRVKRKSTARIIRHKKTVAMETASESSVPAGGSNEPTEEQNEQNIVQTVGKTVEICQENESTVQ